MRAAIRVTIVLRIAQIIVTIRTAYKTTAIIPVLALKSIMTCLVHRTVILGLINSESQRSTAPFILTTCIAGDISMMKGYALHTRTGLELQTERSVADRI